MIPMERSIAYAAHAVADGRMTLPQALQHVWDQGRHEEHLDNERMKLAEREGRRLSRAGRGRGR